MSYDTDLPTSARRQASGSDAPTLDEVLDDGRGGGYEASDVYYVPWADVDEDGVHDVYKFLDVVAGSAETIATGGFGTRYIPLRFPVANQILLAYNASSRNVGWDPAGVNPATAAATGWYRGAFVTIRYRTPRFDLSGDEAMLTVSGQPATHPMLVPAGVVGGTTFPMQVGGYLYNCSIRNVAGFSPDAWGPGSGRQNVINDDVWRGLPARTVKLPALGFNRTVRWGGTATDDVSFPLEIRNIPWNQEYDDTGSLVSHTMYDEVDMATLLGFG